VSYQATNWVMSFSRSRLSDRLVMLSIAHRISNDTGEAFPSVATIARECNISESQVHASLRKNRRTGELDFDIAASQLGTNIYRLPKFLDWLKSSQSDDGHARERFRRGANSAPLPAAKGARAEQRRGTAYAPAGYSFEVQNVGVKSAPELSAIRAAAGVAAPLDQAKYIETLSLAEKMERHDKRILKISEQKKMPGVEAEKRKRILALKGNEHYPTDALRAELWDGIHRKRIFDRFIDGRFLSHEEQLLDCLQVGVDSIMENRKAKMLAAGVEDQYLKAAALGRLPEHFRSALASIGNFNLREVETVAAVIHAIVEAAVDLLRRSSEPTLFALA